MVPGFAQHYVSLDNITIRNCVIGGPDAFFSYGVVANDGVDLRIEGAVFEDSPIGLSIWSGSGAVIASNQFVRTPLEAINFAGSGSGSPANGRIEGNSIEMMAAPGGLDWGWGLDIYGMAGPMSGTTVADNTISGGTGAIRLGLVWSTEVTRNSLSESAFAALEYSYPSPTNRLWWNNLESFGYGVFSTGPAEISDGEGRGNWWGHDCSEALFVAGVDSNDEAVVDSFPYGRRGGWELGLEPGCDTTPPEAPVILSPVFEEGVTYISTPVVLGTAEPFARVRVFEGSTELGADYASGDGDFAISLVPLMSGQHVIHATAVDASGNESASSTTVAFGIQVIDEGNPISGENGKFKIVELSVSPNPFDPGIEKNQLRLTLEVDAVKGLGGDTKNHRFFAVTARTVLDPETLETITTSYAASEIVRDTDGPVRVTVADEWDGKDEAGQTLENPKAYPAELSVAVVRLYAGKGNGPYPSLRVGEFLTLEQMSEIMMQVRMFERPKQPDPRSIIVEQVTFKPIVDVQNPYAFPRYQTASSVIWSFDPRKTRARSCGEAYVTCSNTTKLPDVCFDCFDACEERCQSANLPCAWPSTIPGGVVCTYCANPVCLLSDNSCLNDRGGVHERAPCPESIFTRTTVMCDTTTPTPSMPPGFHDGVCAYLCPEVCVREATRFEINANNCVTPMPRDALRCAEGPNFCERVGCNYDSIGKFAECEFQCDPPYESMSCVRRANSCDECTSVALCEGAN
ncbi:MAG: hypothetical protein COW42_03260 [Deltaproteobacteria bacterium CG17_big_fil_post_rev_8_21_14_2_50_63_7]|nr:MAG: hypothetical protein COW42_03260 [Deltaproteobacteria bacterium CG17_big_fil_post_rev_8_21_14_2_50_63_7]